MQLIIKLKCVRAKRAHQTKKTRQTIEQTVASTWMYQGETDTLK